MRGTPNRSWQRRGPMSRTLLLLVLLAVPAQAAPRLKPQKPAQGSEEARIEAIRAERDRIRTQGSPEERRGLNTRLLQVNSLIRQTEAASPEHRVSVEGKIQERIDREGLRDLFDLVIYDGTKRLARGK